MPAVAIYLAPLWFAGCARPCEGADCADLYPAAELYVARGSKPLGDVDVVRGEALLSGTAEEGWDWHLAVEAGRVRVGVPAVGEVRWYDLSGARLATLAGDAGVGFAAQVATVGEDLVVGAPLGGEDERGRVYRHDGGGGVLGTVDGERTGDRLGSRVVGCGDVDGDGAADWAATAAWGESAGVILAGDVYLAGSTAVPGSGGRAAGELWRVAGDVPGELLGHDLWCAGSLDGDSLAELVVGAPYDVPLGATADRGTVSVWRGGPAMDPGAPDLVLAGTETGERFGSALAVGELDGDGLPDLAVGAPGHDGAAAATDNSAGAVYVFLGASLRAALVMPGGVEGALAADRRVDGVYARERAGSALALVDLDGDGLDELVVGAPGLNPTGASDAVQAGAVYLFPGGARDWPAVQDVSDAAATLGGDRQYLRAGERFAAGDLDGDGLGDLVILVRAPDPAAAK